MLSTNSLSTGDSSQRIVVTSMFNGYPFSVLYHDIMMVENEIWYLLGLVDIRGIHKSMRIIVPNLIASLFHY